jgi:hypothetical protein
MLSILTAKTEGLYFACSPECGVVSYGGCRDEALNNLAEEIRTHRTVQETHVAVAPSPNAPRR